MKTIKWIIGIVIVIIILSFLTVYIILKRSEPVYEGQITAIQLKNNVEITFDQKGIPQVWAQNEKDAMFAMGWLHASERLFQMDMTRRISQGRLSEVLGEITLKMDKDSRVIGHNRMAKAQLNFLSENNRKRLQSYADGINAYIEQCAALPFEFYVLSGDIKPWTVYDCLTIFSFQTWYSDALQNRDLMYVVISAEKGKDVAESLLFDYPDWAPVTVPAAEISAIFPDIQAAIARSFFQNRMTPFVLTTASNSWVVSPQKSISGSAMLASDPHLEITRLPQFWFYNGLHIEETNTHVLGISAAGLPFIVMGHNGNAAWAFTAAGVDITEYYEEKIDEQDSTRYLTAEGWQSFEIFNEPIHVEGMDKPLDFKVYQGIHGPLFYKNDSLKKAYAVDWAGFDTDLNRAISAGFDLYNVTDFNDFRQIVTNFGALDANWTYADKNGDIGYQLGTPIPVRPAGGKNLPLKGWETDKIWQGYYPLDQTPFAFNPEKGWLATANNKQQREGLTYNIEGNFAEDRILRLEQLLSDKEKYSVNDFKAMQLDITDAVLLRWRDKIIEPLKDLGDDGIALSAKLAAWDGYCGVQSTETAFIYIFLEKLKKNIFADELPELYQYMRYSWLAELVKEPQNRWFDNIQTAGKTENGNDIIKKSLNDAWVTLSNKKWSDIQDVKMEHPFAIIPAFDLFLDLKKGPWKRGGTKGTLNASYSRYNAEKENFSVIVAPSWRFIIDFANPDKIEMVLPAGNSGNPMSPHFDDFTDLWKTGEYWSVPLSREEVFKSAVTKLIIKSTE